MKKTLCPKCKSKGNKIKFITVKNLVRGEIDKENYYVCHNKECDVVYFNDTNIYKTSDLKVQVWFKNSSDENCPICYCSKLTRKEIKESINKGYKTIIDIREYTNKKITGNCLTENPLGKCCHKAFQKEIEHIIKDK